MPFAILHRFPSRISRAGALVQHFYVHIRNGPPGATVENISEFLQRASPLSVHKLPLQEDNENTLFVADLLGKRSRNETCFFPPAFFRLFYPLTSSSRPRVGKDALDKALARDRQFMMGKPMDVYRIVRYQFEDALESVKTGLFQRIKHPLVKELNADDVWYNDWACAERECGRSFVENRSSVDFFNSHRLLQVQGIPGGFSTRIANIHPPKTREPKKSRPQ